MKSRSKAKAEPLTARQFLLSARGYSGRYTVLTNLKKLCVDCEAYAAEWKTRAEKAESELADLRFGAAQEVSPPSPVCKAQRTGVGANDPIDCDWPFCGCDPKADKVIEAIQESGFEIVKTGGDTRELKAALRWIPVKEKLPPVEQDVLVWVKFEGYNEWQWTDSWLDQDGTWALGSAERYTVSHWRHVLNPTESERLLG